MPVGVICIDTPGLGDRSYLVCDRGAAAVVDPQRDVDRILKAAGQQGARITDVLETHIHNDYVSGGLELARRSGARYWVAADEAVGFSRRPLADGDRIALGSVTLRAVWTPGHTPNHLAFVVEENGEALAVFTGGSLLYGTVGRTDLLGAERAAELAAAQHRSVRRLAGALPQSAAVYPTHGFGSFCASTPAVAVDASSIGVEAHTNLALTIDDEGEFVAALLRSLTAYPRYYAHMGAINRAGPPPQPQSPPHPLDPEALADRVRAGEWVVDLRERCAFAAAHLAGTVSVELSDLFAPHLGWVMRWGAPLSLLASSQREVAEAVRQLARIGIDHLAGAAIAPSERLAESTAGVVSYPVATFADLAAARTATPEIIVLDVRQRDEWDTGHVDEAIHIPFDDVEGRLDELPPRPQIWVHCAAGLRAAISASLLDRAGRRTVLVNDLWEHAEEAGLPIVRP